MEFSLLRFDFDIYYQYLYQIENRTVPLYFKKNYVTMSLVHPITFKSIKLEMPCSCLNLFFLLREREREGGVVAEHFQNCLCFV